MLIAWLAVIIGFVGLAWAADRFVFGASGIAQRYGVSPLFIGVTIVALGTSLPEVVVSIKAALGGRPGLAIGNVLGSNIANVGLVLGITALIAPLRVRSKLLRREYPILGALMLAVWLMMMDGYFGQTDGLLLLVGLAAFMAWLASQASHERREVLAEAFAEGLPGAQKLSSLLFSLAMGIFFLPITAHLIVEGSVTIAEYFGVSELVIGLTIVAIGTSLPEVATSITAAIRGQYDLSIGNIIGSNMFNLLAVLPFPGLIAPAQLNPVIYTRDIPIMLGMAGLLMLFSYGHKVKLGRLSRLEGAVLLGLYFSYMGYLAFFPW